jgi:hypothetical protein
MAASKKTGIIVGCGVGAVVLVTVIVLLVVLLPSGVKGSGAGVVTDLNGEIVPSASLTFTPPVTYLGTEALKSASATLSTSTRVVSDANGEWEGDIQFTASGDVTAEVRPSATSPSNVSDPPTYATSPIVLGGSVSDSTTWAPAIQLPGWSVGSTNVALRSAITQLNQSGSATFRVTYSYVPAGVATGNGDATVTLEEQGLNPDLNAAAFQAAIRSAFASWKDIMQEVFSPVNGYGGTLDVEFVENGVETGSPPALNSTSYTVGDAGTGDVRFAMYTSSFPSGVLAFAYLPTSASPNPATNLRTQDIHVNGNVNWRPDASVDPGVLSTGFSWEYVAVHEIGHAVLGLGHDCTTGAVMFAVGETQFSMRTSFPGGFEASPYERAALAGMYPADLGR